VSQSQAERQQTLDFEARLEVDRQRANWLTRAPLREPLRQFLFAIRAGKPVDPSKTRGKEIFRITWRELARRIDEPLTPRLRRRFQRLRNEAVSQGILIAEIAVTSNGGMSATNICFDWLAIEALAKTVPALSADSPLLEPALPTPATRPGEGMSPPGDTEKTKCRPPATSPPCHDHGKNENKNHGHDHGARPARVATPKRANGKPPPADGVFRNSFHGWPEKITNETLRDPVAVDRFYRHAIEQKWIQHCDAVRLNFFATAAFVVRIENAKRGTKDAIKNPGAYFTKVWQNRPSDGVKVAATDEDKAQQMLQSLATPPDQNLEGPLIGKVHPAFLLHGTDTASPLPRSKHEELARLESLARTKQGTAKGGPS